MSQPHSAADELTPWLTVVMPLHNGAHFLEETLSSLLSGQMEGVEVIAIDSSDDYSCTQIINRFRNRLNIAYYYRPDLKPWPAKTNEAVRMARGQFISMLHQDDLWLPGRAAILHDAIKSYPAMAVHLSPAYIVNESSKRLGLWRCPLSKMAVWQEQDLLERLLVQNFVAIPAPAIRRECWTAIGGMDEDLWYTADWDVYLKLSAQGDFVYEAQPTTAFRIHASSLTIIGSRDTNNFGSQMMKVLDRHGGRLQSRQAPLTLKLARASIAINTALAAGINGKAGYFLHAIGHVSKMWPHQFLKYMAYSRLADRVVPRLRAFLFKSKLSYIS